MSREGALADWRSLLARRLTLCVSPPGFGKTSLLASWYQQARASGHAAIWLSVSSADADPAALMERLALALRWGVGVEASADATTPRLGTREPALDRLLSLAEETPLLVFVDNYHEVDGPAVAAMVEQGLASAGDLHLVIASRTEPLFRYAALLLDGRAWLVDADALKFSARECAAFVRANVTSVALTEGEQELIYQKSEGWPVAVQLCCVLIERRRSSAFLREFSGRDVDLALFLNEQVFSLLNIELQRFAARAALLDVFCAGLCDRALGRSDSAAHIAELLRQKLFTFSVDRNGIWVKFQQMFREFLLATPLRPGPEEEATILAAAARWYRDAGRPVHAIEHAMRAGDHELARAVMISSAQTMVRDEGRLPNLLEWSGRLPVQDTPASLELRFWTCWSLAFSCRYQEAEREIRQLERSLADSTLDRRTVARYRMHIASLVVAIRTFQDRSRTVYETSQQWLASYRRAADPFHVGVVAGARLICARLQLEVAEAKRAIELAKRMIVHANSPYGEQWIIILDALGQMEFGDYRVAQQNLISGYRESASPGGEVSVIHSTMALLLAKAVFEQGDAEAAQAYVREGYVHIANHGLIETAAAGLTVRCYSLTRSDPPRAMAELRKAGFLAGHYPPRLGHILRQIAFDLLLDAGELEEARREAALMGITAEGVREGDDEEVSPLVQQQKQVIVVKLRLLDGDADAARALLQELLAQPSTAQRPRFQAELLALEAAALMQSRQAQQACRIAMRALDISVRNGLFQVFLESRRFFAPVVRELLQRRRVGTAPEDELLARLAEALGLGAGAASASAPAVTVELTRRERELLQLLETGLSVQALADHLFLSRATVKWHLHNLYGKLGVRSRAAALAWMRQRERQE